MILLIADYDEDRAAALEPNVADESQQRFIYCPDDDDHHTTRLADECFKETRSYVLAWHVNAQDAVPYLRQLEWPPALRAVVLYRGIAFAGLRDREAADTLLKKSGMAHLVHILPYAVPGNVPYDIRARFASFRDAISMLMHGDKIPFNCLEPPPWPEELVAAYLALVANEKDRSCDVTGDIVPEVWTQAQEQARELMITYGDGGAVELTDPAKRAAALPALRAIFQRIAEKQSP